jgi:release factor glutamine methyltransferase
VTLHERLAAARARLVRAGITTAEAAVDVDVLARHVLSWDRAHLIAARTGIVPVDFEVPFAAALARREGREPTAYIVGEKEFWGRAFEVSPAVLIPRPETELVVEEVLDLVGGRRALSASAARAADVGTGSGCLAVSIACELPACRVVATDVSPPALEVARANAVRHGVAARIDFLQTSHLDGVEGLFDLVVSNPPYVPEPDRATLAPEVLREPDTALFSGQDGLRDVAAVLDSAARSLRPGGWLVIEFGCGQEPGVRSLVADRPALRVAHIRADLQGIPRTAIIERP